MEGEMKVTFRSEQRWSVAVLIGALVWATSFYFRATPASAQQSPPTASPEVAGPDSDGDGIPDAWEMNGVDVINAAGQGVHLDLPGKGASPKHKDVIVFVAWMEGADGHTHRPMPTTLPDGTVEPRALSRAYQAFKNIKLPNLNPDGSDGVNLILIDADQPIKENQDPNLMHLGDTSPDGTEYDWSDYLALVKSQLFYKGPPGIDSVIHFCLFGHQLGGVNMDSYTGIARAIPGKDFIVSLGSVGNPQDYADQQVGTFLHELGHDLGLQHGGGDPFNSKPNYPSIMNYLFQLTGTIYAGKPAVYAYSDIDVPLDENTLVDKNGISTNTAYAEYGSVLNCPTVEQIASFNAPVHWDCDESSDNYSAQPHAMDVNNDRQVTNLSGYADGMHLKFDTRSPTGVTIKVPANQEPNLSNLSAQAGAFAPTVNASAQGDAIALDWTRIPLQAVKGYQVLRNTAGANNLEPIGTTADLKWLDSAVQRNINYTYEVRSVLIDDLDDVSAPVHTPYRVMPGTNEIDRGRIIGLGLNDQLFGAIAAERPSPHGPTTGRPSKPVSVTIR
jgi:hypothetical protein